jgi:hypothetical protein
MPRIKGNQKWEVKNGKPMLVTPAVAAKSEEVPVERLDRQIQRIGSRKERAAEALAAAQAEYDELVAFEAELTALREQVS